MYLLPGNAVNRAAPLNRGLVSWWMVLPNRLGGGGNTFRDFWRSNHGTLAGPTIKWSGGILSLDSGTDFVNFGTSGWSFTDAVTFELVTTFLATDTTTVIFGRPYDGSNALALVNIAETSQNIGFGFYNGSWHLASDSVAFSSRLNSELHIIGTYDRANLRLYVNGVKAGETAETAALPSITSSLCLGANTWISSHRQKAKSAAVFNIAMSDAVAKSRYAAYRQNYRNELNWQSRPVWGAQQAAGTFNPAWAINSNAYIHLGV
jgi:hypothetical protein